MKNIWAYVVVLIVVVAACFGIYYLGMQNKDTSPSGYIDTYIDRTQDILNFTPETDEEYDGKTNLQLGSVSKKYGLGDLVISSSSEKVDYDFSKYMNGFWFSEHASNSFLTFEKYPSESGAPVFVYAKISTKIGVTVDGQVTYYDGSVVFGFDELTDGTLSLKYTYAAYGSRGYVSTFYRTTGSNGRHNIAVDLRCPYLLADDLTEVSALLSQVGLETTSGIWKIYSMDGDQIYFKDSALLAMADLVEKFSNSHLNLASGNYLYKFDASSYLDVLTETAFDNVLCDVEFRNTVSVYTYRDLFDLNEIYAFWHWFNHEYSVYNVQFLDIVC